MRNIRFYIQFITEGIWRQANVSYGNRRWNLMSILKIVVLSVKLCFKQRLNVQASSLSYYTFFALIPILAFIIAIIRGFGFEVLVSDFLSSSLNSIFDPKSKQIVFSMIESYLNHAKGGMFIGIGLIMLLWSVYNVFSQIEKAINQIWETNKKRRLITQCSYYLSIIVIIPFLFVIVYGINVYLDYFEDNWLVIALEYIKPYIVCSLILTFTYIVLPNTKVNFSSALLAGIIAGCVVVVFKNVFFLFMKLATSYNAVYGSLALIPILMLFLRFVWIIVLCGAEISYARQNYEMYDFADEVKKISPRYQLCVELFIIRLLAKSIENKEKFLSFSDILSIYPFPPRLLSVVLSHMCDCNLIVEMEDKERHDSVYVLTSDLSKLTYGNIYASVQQSGKEDFLKLENEAFSETWSTVKEMEATVESGYNTNLIK